MRTLTRNTTLLTLLMTMGAAQAGPDGTGTQSGDDWQIMGQIQGRYDTYHVSGDSRAAPYLYQGGQGYGNFSLDARRSLSSFEQFNTQLAGTLNRSEYRGVQGGILERARLEWSKGDATLPFRLELGDVYSLHSQRTLQRGLKGMQLELQNAETGGVGQSLLVTAGRAAPTWRGLNANREDYLAASWLLQTGSLGDFMLSSVNAYRQGAAGAADIRQWSGGLGWAKDMQLASQRWQLEGELTSLSGNTATYSARRDAAQFFSLEGRDANLPLQYGLRLERNGAAYQPLGGAVVANQKAASGQVRWRFDNGVAVSGRLQSYRDGWDKQNGALSPVAVNTDVAGITLSGRLPEALAGTASLDVQSQKRLADNGTQFSRNQSLRADFFHTLPNGYGLRWGIFDMVAHDLVTGIATNTREPSASLSKSLQIGTMHGSGSLGVVHRNVSGATPTQSVWAPTLQLQLSGGPHSFGFSYNFMHARASSGILELFNRQTSLRYQYRSGAHEFSVDGDLLQRDPMGNLATRAWRMGVGYAFHFESLPQAGGSMAAAPSSAATVGERDLALIAPGIPLSDASAMLERWGMAVSARTDRLLIYDYPWFDNVALPQQLVLEQQGGELLRTELLLELQDATPAEVQRYYARVRDPLLRQFGAPSLAIEEGAFTDTWSDDLAVGRLRYVMEWQSGRSRIRLGIPLRMDGRRVIEIAVTPATAPALDMRNWGLEPLR